MALSPEAASKTIEAIIAPALMLSVCALLLNGFIPRYTAIDRLLRSFEQEVRNLKYANVGDDDTNVERLDKLIYLIPKVLHQHHLLHNLLMLIYFALFLFVVDMLIVAISISTSIQWISYFVLTIFLLAVCILGWSLFVALYELRISHDFIQLELQRACQYRHQQRRKR